jgi:hypothetical protein
LGIDPVSAADGRKVSQHTETEVNHRFQCLLALISGLFFDWFLARSVFHCLCKCF